MNPLLEYRLYKEGSDLAMIDEWEDWADRIVACLRAELKAADSDHERYVLLKHELDKARTALDFAMSENQRLTKLLEEV